MLRSAHYLSRLIATGGRLPCTGMMTHSKCPFVTITMALRDVAFPCTAADGNPLSALRIANNLSGG